MINNKGHVLNFGSEPIPENGPLDSSVVNNIFDSLKTSTLRCLNRTRDLSYRLSKFNKALSAENYYLTNVLLQKDIQAKLDSASKTALITGFDPIEDGSAYEQNRLTGQITVAAKNKWSKIVRYKDKDGRNRASKDTYIAFGPTGGILPQPQDSDIYQILDGYSDTFWIADVSPNTQYNLQIQFPTSIKPFIDFIQLVPFPAFSFKLDAVYVTKADGSRVQVVDAVSSNLGILSTHIKPVSWGGTLDIYFTTNSTTGPGVVGISDIEVGLVDYEESNASFIIEVPGFQEIPFSYLDYINLFDVANEIEDQSYKKEEKITVTAYWGPDWTTASATPIPVDRNTLVKQGNLTAINKPAGDKFYLEFSMGKYLGQTPIFRAAKITYKE